MRLLLLPILLLPPVRSGPEEDLSGEVDRLMASTWNREKLTPSGTSDDAEFLRRLTLDLLGRIPTAREATEFLDDRAPDKRRRKIDEFLASPEHAKAWARIWLVRLIGRDANRNGNSVQRAPLEAWLEKAIAANLKYDAFVRELIAAEGSTDDNGAVGYVAHRVSKVGTETAPNLAGHVVRTFLGIRLQCAQCHDHPYEKWKQEDFWGIAAYFARVRLRPTKKDGARLSGIEISEADRGEVRLPDSEKTCAPRFPFDTGRPSGAGRREQLASLVTSRKNPAFAKALVNWIWHRLFGAGFVHPVDDFSAANRPSIPEVLDLLARDFADRGFDVRRLLRVILNTKTYQLSSRSSRDNAEDRRFFSKARVRPMMPEHLIRSLETAAGAKLRGREGEQQMKNFLFLFDNDEKGEPVDFEATVTEALFRMNGTLTTGMLRGPVRTIRESSDRIEAVFLTVLARRPTDAERRRFSDYVRQAGDRDETWADLLWVLLNTTEFFFNH